MASELIYNKYSFNFPQMPINNGQYRYISLIKHCIIIKNISDYPLYNQNIKLVFREKSQIIKIDTSNLNYKIDTLNNLVTITIDCLQIKHSFNIDILVANGNLKDKFEIIYNSLSLRRVKKIAVKKNKVNKKTYLNKIKSFFYDPWTIAIVSGFLFGLLGYSLNNSKSIDNRNLDSIKFIKKNAIQDSIVNKSSGIK